jgi:hypothetical protein
MRPRRIVLLALVAASVSLAVVAAVAAAASAGGVTASLTGHAPGKQRLQIKRNGQVFYNQPVRAPGCGSLCIATAVAPGKSQLRVLDLESDHEVDIVLGLYSGGAHCCFIDQVFTLDPGTMTYVKISHGFLDSDPVLKRVNGRFRFVGNDARIAESGLTDFADSGAPIEIWKFAGRFQDVTRQYPNLVRPDAAKWLKLFNHHVSNGVGLITAWAADEDLLGQSKLVASSLKAYAAKGALRIPQGLPQMSGQRIASEIQSLLRRLGYTK